MISTSNEDLCQLAYEGKLMRLQEIIKENKQGFHSIKCQNERQPLHWACTGGHRDVVDYLINDCNSPIDEPDDSGWTPLLISASSGHDAIVKDLLQRFADPNKTNSTGHTALHYAASKNRVQIAEMLVASDADVNVHDHLTKATPLHRAASKGHLKIVEMLIKSQCDINVTDSVGNTPLHLACEEERTEVAETLVYNNASLTILNKDSKSPLDVSMPYLKRRLQGS